MNFFFSMAASRNPSFFGQLGEAGQQLARADAAARAEALQERRLDIEAGYRASQEERQLRELQQYEDPNSLRGRYIQAQIEELNARRDRAARDSGTPTDPVVGRERDDQGRLYNIYRSGRVTLVGGEGGPTFVDRSNTPQARAYNDYLNRRAAFTARLAENPMTQGELGRRALRQWEEDNPRPPNPYASPSQSGPTTTAPTEPTGNRVRLPGID